MNEQEIQILLEDLAGRGFDDAQLRKDIERNEALGLPVFSITRDKEFGDERMKYKLSFQWQESSLSYKLTSIDANHRMPIDIEEKKFGGFDTAILDKGMSMINWKQYWKDTLEGVKIPDSYPMAADHIDSLSQLLLSGISDAKHAAEELMYKHFPTDIFTIFSERQEIMQRLYEHSYNFSLEVYPVVTAELAYFIISERFDSLELKVEEFATKLITPEEIRNEIYRQLKWAPEQAELSFEFLSGNNSVDIIIPVSRSDGWYEPQPYWVSVTPLPEIPQGTFNNVDSDRLDKKMATVDWKNDQEIVFLNEDENIAYPRDIELLQEELFRMALDPEGKKAADLLMLKHYLHAPFFEDMISTSAHEILRELPKRSSQFGVNIPLNKAVNLVAGRPVMMETKENVGQTNWVKMDFSEAGMDGTLKNFEGISESGLKRMIEILPINDHEKTGMLISLMNGAAVKAETKIGVPITIMVRENAEDIKISDAVGREIPFNFQLDPDWEQKNEHDINPKASQKNENIARSLPSSSKRKGRGI